MINLRARYTILLMLVFLVGVIVGVGSTLI